MSPAPKTTLLFHTRNRPSFLLRALDNFDRSGPRSDIDVIVLDASTEELSHEFQKGLSQRNFDFKVKVLRSTPSTPFRDRFRDALKTLDTPFVVLAADDDIYFFDWMAEAAEILESEPSIGTVYGHVLSFQLEAFVPYGALTKYYIRTRRNPPVHWLEAPAATDRLLETGDGVNGHVVTGWYALQRTSQLRETVRIATEIDLRSDLFEYLLVFCQATMGRTRMLDRIVLARQEDPGRRHPTPDPSDAQPSLERLMESCAAFLVEREDITQLEADRIVDRFFAGPRRQLQRAHAKRHLRRLADELPFLRTIWTGLMGRPQSPAHQNAASYPDPRLPPIPSIDREHPAIRKVEEIVSPGSATASISAAA